MAYEWDWPGAELEFKRSMGLKASSGVAHFRYAEYLVSMGRLDEGLAESKNVQEIDPLSPRMAGELAYHYLAAHRYDDSIAQYKKAIELDPTLTWLHSKLGLAYASKGMCRASQSTKKWDSMPTKFRQGIKRLPQHSIGCIQPQEGELMH
jgi:tetratricopeptide (TPR) repeat protein